MISYALAAAYNLIQPLPGVQTVESFSQYISSIIPFILSLAAVLAVIMIILGGVEYAVSLSEEGKKTARGRITNAIWGLLLALVSWLILNTINPQLTSLDLNIQGLPASQTGGTNQPPTNNTNQPPAPTNNDIVPPPSKGSACPPGSNNTFCNVGDQCRLSFGGNPQGGGLPYYICTNQLTSVANPKPTPYCIVTNKSAEFCAPYGGCSVAALKDCGSCPSGQTCYFIYEGQPK